MNDIDPQAWLADVLARLPDMPASRVHELLPWKWKLPHARKSVEIDFPIIAIPISVTTTMNQLTAALGIPTAIQQGTEPL